MVHLSLNQEQKAVTIDRTFNLPLEIVWKAFSEPENFKLWFGPEGFICPTCRMDFNVGGKYLISMKALDGHEIWSTGKFLEITPMSRIVYTHSFADNMGNVVRAAYYNLSMEWAMERLVTLGLMEADGKTKISLYHMGIPSELGPERTQAWHSSFDKLESNLK